MTRMLGRMLINQDPQFAILLIVTVALGAARAALPPAEPTFGVLSWDSSGGLPRKSATAMARTPDGYLWLGTRSGLLRFDGVRFVTITTDTTAALGDNRIRSLVVDRSGVLWIGTEGGTLSQRRAGEFLSVHLDSQLHGTSIESLAVADEGGIWLGTDKWGLVRLSNDSLDFSNSTNNLTPGAARSMIRLANGEWWTMAGNSLVRLTKGAWEAKHLGLGSENRFLALALDRRGTGLWLATTANRLAPNGRGARIFKIEGDKIVRELAPYPWPQDSRYSIITSLIEDGQGRVWVATHLNGVYYWQAEQGWRELRSRKDRSYLQIAGFHADGDGLLWMATQDGGLHRITKQKVATVPLPPAQAREIIVSVCTTRDGTLWAATEDAGVFRFQENRFLQVTNGLPSATIGILFEDTRTNLWVGTRRGLFRWSGDKFQPVSPKTIESAVYAMFEDRAGNLWVGNGPCVVQLSPNGETRVFDHKSGLGNGTVVGLAEDAHGRVYASKESTGLFRLKGDQFESLGLTSLGPGLGASGALWPDEEGGLWIATGGQGLCRLSQDTLTGWAFEDGLPNEYLRSIMPDGTGILWFNASKGIFGCSIRALLDYKRGETPPLVFWRLSEIDGMEGNWTSGLGQPVASRSIDGRLWFPNRNVVAVIEPEVVMRAHMDHYPMIEEIVVDGTIHPRARDGTLQLPSGARHIQIHYTCADLQSPEVRRFRFCLEGLDVDWVEAGTRRVAYYGPLKPGDFRFRVMVGSELGEWLECEAPLVLSVLPRWWERTSIRFLGAFAMVFLLTGTVWRVVAVRHGRQVQKLEQQLAREAERREAEMKAQQLRAYRDVGRDIALILSETGSSLDAMPRILEAAKKSTGVDAVGIRLQDEDDFPYFYQEGFSEDFLRKENSLLKRERDGGICRDANGKVSLECTCGLVISGNTDPANPLFTRHGSAWTNDSFSLLDLPSHQDPRTNPRNECIHQGYASVALIPIRAKGRIIGLLHLNGHRKGCFTHEAIEVLEDATENIGEALLRKRAEEKIADREAALRHSEKRLIEAQRIAHIGSWELDLLTDTLIWSDEIFRIFEIDKERFGASYEFFLSTVHPDDRDAVNTAYQQSLVNRKPYEITHRLLMSDGRIKFVHEHCETTYSPEGRPLRSVGTAQDITESKQTEEEIKRLQNQYTHMARVSAMGELVASLAHELKQPLAAIRSNAQAAQRFLAVDKLDIDELHEILKDIIKDDRRADDVIQKLRALMQRRELQIARLDINEVIREILPLFNSHEIVRNISLSLELGKDVSYVSGDRIQLQQVVLNLILNSSEALIKTEQALRRIVVRTNQSDNDSVTVSVTDNGPGIDEAVLSHLFEPFYTTKKEGLGMGLAISRSIIVGHKGRMWAQNNHDGGATFYFTIPTARENQV